MDPFNCRNAFACLPRLFSDGSFINLDFLSDDNLGPGLKGSGESDEVMLSDPQSGDLSSPGENKDEEYGGRDDEAAMDYGKKTTTDTEQESMDPYESETVTTAPQSQSMDVKSNVVPAPSELAPVPMLPDEESKRSSEEALPELSVGHPSIHDNLNELGDDGQSTTQPSGAEAEFLSPEGTLPRNIEDGGSVKIHGEDGDPSHQASSPSLSFGGSENAPSSPVMFTMGDRTERLEPPPESAQPVVQERVAPLPESSQPPIRETFEPVETTQPAAEDKNVLDPTAFSGIGGGQDVEKETELIKQTMETMAQSPPAPPVQTAPPVLPPERRQPMAPSGSSQSSGSTEHGSSSKKGGMPTLPPRGMGMGGLQQRTASGSSSTQPKPQSQSQPPAPKPPSRPAAMPPAGIGGSGGLPPLRSSQTASRPQPPAQTTASPQTETQVAERPAVGNGGEGGSSTEPADVAAARNKLLDIRLKVLRIAARLGLRPLDFAITDFMARIDRTEQLRFRSQGRVRPQLDTLFNQATQLDETTGPNSNLEMTVTAVVIGPVGCGKSSAIRNLLHPGPGLAPEFAPGPTEKISVHTARVNGVTFRLIDTPGLSVAASSIRKNMDILKNVRRVINKYKPDAVVYVDRMDLFRRELSDIPLLRLVNEMLPEMLYNCVALLTHGNAPPPDAGHGVEMSYIEYQRTRAELLNQIITHAISDMRWAGRPLGFENHPNCSLNADGIPVLPSGQAFKKHALFQLISSHINGEIEKVCRTKELRKSTVARMMFMMTPRKQLQLSALVSQLLSSKPPKKFPDEERELMTRREIKRLDSQADKVEEENKRRDYTRLRKVEILQEEAHPSQVPIVGANMELSPSFDHEVNQHRYNATDFVYGWSVRPIMSAQDNIFEHDDGVEMFQVARDGVLRTPGKCVDGLPASMIVQAGKGKNFGNVQMDAGFSQYASRNLVTTASCIVHPAGQDGEVVYTPTVDIRTKIAERNKLTVGGMACRLAESGWPHKGQLGLGGKVENKYKIKDGVKLTAAAGGMTAKPSANQARDTAYGANVELKLAGGKGEYDPSFLFSGGVSHQRRGSFKRTGFSGQISHEQAISPETLINARLQMSAGGSGTTSLRMITHDKARTGILIMVPMVIKTVKRILGQGDEFV